MKGKIKLEKKVTWDDVDLGTTGKDAMMVGFMIMIPGFNLLIGLILMIAGFQQRKVTWEQVK